MALVLKDRVKETTTTTGTGTLTLAGASTGYQSFSAIGNGNTCYYAISSSAGSEWEVGLGTYTSAGTTLARTTILASSNSGSVVTLSAGTKDVYVVYPAGKAVYGNGTVIVAPSGTILPIANGGTNQSAFTSPSGNIKGLVYFDGTSQANDVTVTHAGYDTTLNTLNAQNFQVNNGLVCNNMTVGTSFTIPTGYSASSTGAITLSSGVTVTVPSGSRWVVL